MPLFLQIFHAGQDYGVYELNFPLIYWIATSQFYCKVIKTFMAKFYYFAIKTFKCKVFIALKKLCNNEDLHYCHSL